MSSILEAYRTGRGRITVRGKTDVELLDLKTKRTAVIIKEVTIMAFLYSLLELSALTCILFKGGIFSKLESGFFKWNAGTLPNK